MHSMASTLVVLQGSCLPLSSLETLITQHGVSPGSADITTDPARCLTSGYGRAVLVLSNADPAVLGPACKLLKPGASVVLHLPQAEQVGVLCVCLCSPCCCKQTSASLTDLSLFVQADACSAMLLSGFTDCQATTSAGRTTVSARDQLLASSMHKIICCFDAVCHDMSPSVGSVMWISK